MAAHLPLNRRYTKAIIFLTVLVVLTYIPLNIIYVMSTVKLKDRSQAQIGADEPKLSPVVQLGLSSDGALRLKEIEPQNDGTVNLILNLNIKQLLELVNPETPTVAPGEVTGNPVPIQTKFVVNNDSLCQNAPDLKWIIYVHSAPQNVKRRQLIRSTWASRSLFKKDITRLVFLMGLPLDATDVLEESKKFGDIVMGDFVDHYKNLTLKGIMGLKWLSTYCKNARYAIKADDDAFVNIFEVSKDMKKYESLNRMIYCPLWKANTMPILRDPKKCMKWCVKKSEFPGKTHFPKYCAGLSFIVTLDIVAEMYQASLTTPFFWIDDVYISGLLTAKVKGVQFVDVMEHFTLKEPLALEHYRDPKVKELKYYFVHGKTPEKFEQFWNETLHRLDDDTLEILTDQALARYPDLSLKQKQRHKVTTTYIHLPKT